MKILFLSRWFPYPPDNGSKLRIFNLLRGLSAHHEIILLSYTEPGQIVKNDPEIASICSDILTFPFHPYNPGSFKARLGWFSMTPRFIIDTYSPEMVKKLSEIIRKHKPDLIIASQLDTAIYQKLFQDIPAIFEEAENSILFEQFRRSSSLRDRFRYGLTWFKHRRYLADLLSGFRACTVVSEKEKELLLSIKPGFKEIEVIPNCINISDYHGFTEKPHKNTLIFTGSFNYYPNYEAMIWFVNQVLPIIDSRIPDTKLIITGDHGNRAFPSQPNIELTGFVKDTKPLVASAWISVVPILSGGGTRLKILEAMGLRTPVVTTSKGAEGLNVKNGSNLLIGDSPDEFADHVIRLLNDFSLREKISDEAFELVTHQYEWSIVIPRYLQLIDRVS